VGPAAASKGDAKADDAYILGAEDVVEVEVLGVSDFKVRAKIGSDGTIQVPFLGTIPASARTGKQLGQEVTAALVKGGYYAKPILRVEVVSYASRYVTVLGLVSSPGLVPVDRPYRLSEVMARVGGVRENAADYIIVTPASGEQRQLSIKGLATGDSQADPFVAPGDKIYVPQAELFYISGQVNQPGPHPVTSGMTVRMAIAAAGGLTALGTEKGVKVTHANGKAEKVGVEAKVLPNDVIVINERFF
jgi:polysaccharide export outer membrane protein